MRLLVETSAAAKISGVLCSAAWTFLLRRCKEAKTLWVRLTKQGATALMYALRSAPTDLHMQQMKLLQILSLGPGTVALHMALGILAKSCPNLRVSWHDPGNEAIPMLGSHLFTLPQVSRLTLNAGSAS